jgi:hypothetical protein
VSCALCEGSIFLQNKEWEGGATRPTLLVTMELNGRELTYPMLLDSGSDVIALPAEALENFELTAAECELVQGRGFGGTREMYLAPHEFDFIFEADQREGPAFKGAVRFAPSLDGRAYGIMGRDPTLDYMSWRFGNKPYSGFHIQFY